MFVKIGRAYINLNTVPIVEFDLNDKGRERVIIWLPQGPVAYVKGQDVPEEDFEFFRRTMEEFWSAFWSD